MAVADLPVLDLTGVRRLVVVAAHPDDESLGAGGLTATATTAGVPTLLLVATCGEGSHPLSTTHTRAQLARTRRRELDAAAAELGLAESAVTVLDVPDGEVGRHLDDIVAAMVDLVGDGRGVLIAAPYRADGHPDHEAMGRGAAAAAHRTGAMLAEYPIWMWHAADPREVPWERFARLPLSSEIREAKRAAVASHASQVKPLSHRPGDETLLPPHVLAHFAGDEFFALTAAEDAADGRLDRLHTEQPDPWGAETRWYEERKRSLLLAALPRRRFTRALEVGCSTGVLAMALSGRVDFLVAVDSSAAAVSTARDRLPASVDVRLLAVPQSWPEGRFDLVVVSEVGYFLSPAELDDLVRRVASCLEPAGVVALCHWRHPIRGWPLDAARVHSAFAGGELPPVAASYRDRDVEIVVHAAAEHWLDADT